MDDPEAIGGQANCARNTLGGDELSAVHLSQTPCACPIERHALEISGLKVQKLQSEQQGGLDLDEARVEA